MASKNYSYPRVTMSTVAKKHSHNRVNVPDTTILFAPLWTEKGPDDQVVKVHSLAEFIDIFGSLNEDFYNYNGQQALNVYNWLNNGGTLLVKRLVMTDEVKAQNLQNGTGTYVIEGKRVNQIYTTTNKNASFFDVNESSSLVNSALFSGKLLGFVDLSGLSVSKKGGVLNVSSVTIKTLADDDEEKFVCVPVYDDQSKLYNLYKAENTNTNPLIIAKETLSYNGETYSFRDGGYTTTGENPKYFDLENYSTENNNSFIFKGKIYEINTDEASKLKDDTDLIGFVTVKSVSSSISAKYYGNYYNGLKLELVYVSEKTVDNKTTKYFNVLVKKDKLVVEKFLQVTDKNYLTALSNSEYISIDGLNLLNDIANLGLENKGKRTNIEFELTTTTIDYTYSSVVSEVEDFYKNPTDLKNRLETPIDIILDAGYPETTKKAMANFIRNNSEESLRPDIIGIFDRVELKGRLVTPERKMTGHTELNGNSSPESTNIALYEQYFTINDATFTGQNIYVSPTYFLSKLLPYNDNTYGMQYPTAGLRRGILDDALWVVENPDEAQKDKWFKDRINYVEKSSREYAFMSQRTFDGSDDYEYTALSFLNNARVLEKMKKELEAIGRSYLHEFNDAVTIANMTVALNKYVSNWISNRTLSMGVVEVAQNEESENALDINLTIKFTNTIEVINVSIVIE